MRKNNIIEENMGFRQYKAFFTCIETGSLTEAAKKLNCTQSAISHLLKELEREVDGMVLIRNKGGVRLTEKGALLYPVVKEMVDAEDRVLQKISEIREPKSTLRIGTFTSVAVQWLPALMKGYEEKKGDVNFAIIDGGYKEIADAVKKGKVDVGFIVVPIDGKNKQIPLYKDRLLAVLPKEYPTCDNFPIENFAKEQVITLTEDTDWDSRRVFSKAGIRPNIKYKTSDDYAMIAMVEQGLGICVIPELLLKGRDGNVKTAELMPPSYRNIGLAVATDKENDPLVCDFIEYVKENISVQTGQEE